MQSIDYNSIEELNNLYTSLDEIRSGLNSLLDAEAEVMFEFYKNLAECNISSKLGEKGMLTELTKAGKGEFVKLYLDTEKEVHKAKNSFRQAMEAINLKKHINNCLPK
jgi:hypothetical protein